MLGIQDAVDLGVGVASRGKLRGMSLPVAKVKTESSSDEKPATKKAAAAGATASAKASAGAKMSAAAASTPTIVTSKPKTKGPSTPSPSSATTSHSSITQQPTPTPSAASNSIPYSFGVVGQDAPVQSAPPFQTSFEWSAQQPRPVHSGVHHQTVLGNAHAGEDGSAFSRPPKRRALHLDTSDLPSYAPYQHQQRQQHVHPMTAQAAFGQGSYPGRPYDSPISPYQPQAFDHVRHGSLGSQDSGPFHMNGPQTAQHQHQQFQRQQQHHNQFHHQQSASSPSHWSSGYPSPGAVSEHGSYISLPDAAFHSGGLNDPSIGMAADQLLAMNRPQSQQQPQQQQHHSHHRFMPNMPFASYGAAEVIPETDDEDGVEDIGRGDSSLFDFGDNLIRMNQTFATQEKIGNTPELRYLINYYLEVLTPVILAFDGPGNPWREHVMSLARHNEGLQHAIAALSATNLRMRREHKDDRPRLPLTEDSVHDISVRRSSEAHQRLNDEVGPPAQQAGRPIAKRNVP